MIDRKLDHLDLAMKSQMSEASRDTRFYYEPALSSHQAPVDLSLPFLGKKLQNPLWISSMTGGTAKGKAINQNLAKVARRFGLGMGLGSLRPLLSGKQHFDDFNLRPFIGDELPLYGNLGVAQIDELLKTNSLAKLSAIVTELELDGLFVHINPLQEFLQPEGDRFNRSALEIIEELLLKAEFPIAVKEVGCGMGPASMKALMQLPLSCFEFASYGGTNFSKLELLRGQEAVATHYNCLTAIGHSASEMVERANKINFSMPLIISGGIHSFADAYYLLQKSKAPAIYGLASRLLPHAESEESFCSFIERELEGLKFCHRFLRLAEE